MASARVRVSRVVVHVASRQRARAPCSHHISHSFSRFHMPPSLTEPFLSIKLKLGTKENKFSLSMYLSYAILVYFMAGPGVLFLFLQLPPLLFFRSLLLSLCCFLFFYFLLVHSPSLFVRLFAICLWLCRFVNRSHFCFFFFSFSWLLVLRKAKLFACGE